MNIYELGHIYSALVFVRLFVNIVVFIFSCVSTVYDHSYKESYKFFLQPFTGNSLSPFAPVTWGSGVNQNSDKW